MRRFIILAFVLLAAGVAATSVSAQGPTGIRFIVRDSAATPQPGIRVTLDTGDGRGPQPYDTDDLGATPHILSPTSLITVTRVLDSDGVPLSFETTTLDGLLVIPLSSERGIEIPWAYDEVSRSVISLPRTMENEAFPELEVMAPDDTVSLISTPVAEAPVAPMVVGGEPTPAARSGFFWVIVGGLLLVGVGLGLFVWSQARATQRRQRRPVQRQRGR
jgi:hypothetical protein